MRTLVLHYHLFKNAGTSLDRVLQRNFGPRWVTREFRGHNNSAAVMDWIQETPEAVAFSSHTMMGPLPQIDGVKIISVMLLRDPVERIRSAYRFERKQQAETLGAVLARHTDLEGYVRVRLAMPGDRQCRNFQTFRLASLVPGPEPELDRARNALDRLSVVGRVENFDTAVNTLAAALKDAFPDFDATGTHANRSTAGGSTSSIYDNVSAILEAENSDDRQLLEAVSSHIKQGDLS